MSAHLEQFEGLPMFDSPKARTRDPETSHEAAASVKESSSIQRGKILEALREHGPGTADSLDALIGWRDTTAGRRLKELADLGLVEMTDVKARTRSGRKAFVWKLKKILARADSGS